MAHSKITVDEITGPRELSIVFEAAAQLGVRVHAGRIRPRRAILDLAEGAPVAALAASLQQSGLMVTVSPGDHLIDVLSRRERELMTLLTEGLQLKEVAARMGVQTHTAREYWLRVKRKWDVKTVGQAVTIWNENVYSHGEADH